MKRRDRKTRTQSSLSGEWCETTLRSIGDAVIATDCGATITFMNPVAERLTGWTLAEVKHRRIGDVFVTRDESTGAVVESPIERVLSEGTAGSLPDHTVLVRRDSAETPIEDSAAPIRHEHGALAGAVMIFRDITAERREEDRRAFLARATAELGSSLDLDVTLSTVAKLAVPTMADLSAVALVEDGLVRRLAVAHVDPSKARLVEELARRRAESDASYGWQSVLRTGEPELGPQQSQTTMDGATADEESRELLRQLAFKSHIGVPLKCRGKVIGVIGLAISTSNHRYDTRDLDMAIALADRASAALENARLVEDLRKARVEADARRTEAELANRSKDEFLAMLGHELRNPLAPIVTGLQLMKLRAGGLLERERTIIERQVNHMARLVDDLLDISRIMRGNVTLAKEPVDIAEVVARAIEMTIPLLKQRQQNVDLSVAPELWVEGDGFRLAQVVSNLINNAAKYTGIGGRLWIESHRQGDDQIVLSVRDNGIGIEANMLPRIFELFAQAPQALDRAQGGLGIGLAIVRRVVELHDGSVSARSDGPGNGSEFVIRLPALRRVDQAKASDVGPLTPAQKQHGARILVVDDSVDALSSLVEALEVLGHEPIQAPDGPSALVRATETRPSIALLDIGLPAMDGYELARLLREVPGLDGIKLIALTGYGLEADRARTSCCRLRRAPREAGDSGSRAGRHRTLDAS